MPPDRRGVGTGRGRGKGGWGGDGGEERGGAFGASFVLCHDDGAVLFVEGNLSDIVA